MGTEMTYPTPPPPSVEQLTRALSAVGDLIARIRDDQWSAPTPCTDWTVHDLVNHLVGVNRVFAARLCDQMPPELGADHLGDDPAAAYRDTSAAVRTGFDQPGALERTYHGPLGAISGAAWLQVRITDLLLTAGIWLEPPVNPPSCPKTWPSRHWSFLGYKCPACPASAGSAPLSPSPTTPPPSTGSPPFSAVPSAQTRLVTSEQERCRCRRSSLAGCPWSGVGVGLPTPATS